MRSVQPESDVEREGEGSTAGYVQAFIYRVPKQNREMFKRVEGQLAGIFKEHGIVRSDFYELTPARVFKGFISIAETVSATEDEVVWLELDYYKDAAHRDEVVGRIGQDPRAGPLFGQVLSLCAEGSTSLQGDFTTAS